MRRSLDWPVSTEPLRRRAQRVNVGTGGRRLQHGITIHGTPSERHSEAISIPLEDPSDSKAISPPPGTRTTRSGGIRDGRYSTHSFRVPPQ
jgi:hypothetical protein